MSQARVVEPPLCPRLPAVRRLAPPVWSSPCPRQTGPDGPGGSTRTVPALGPARSRCQLGDGGRSGPDTRGVAISDSHPVQRDAFLSCMGPQAVGMRLRRRVLLGAGHTGISNGVENWRSVGKHHMPEVTDPLDLWV